MVGDVPIGGDAPIAIQSMVTAKTQDIQTVVSQIIELHKAGFEIIRVTTPTILDAQALGDINIELANKYQPVPLVADVHHRGAKIAIEASRRARKVRINPGLFRVNKGRKQEYSASDVENDLEDVEHDLVPLIESCKKEGTVLRLGANHGSLSDRILVTYGDTPLGMVISVMEYIRICEAYGFGDIVVSLKSSDVSVMQEANRLMVMTMDKEGMDYPIHLGVTESGFGGFARIKSAVGIGTILSEGIGDTIRVSLAEDPIQELEVCQQILQAVGVRRSLLEVIACPTCGRTESDKVRELAEKIQERLPSNLPLVISSMGCVVNGPGEARRANMGLVAVGDRWELRKGERRVGSIDLENLDGAVEALVVDLRESGLLKE